MDNFTLEEKILVRNDNCHVMSEELTYGTQNIIVLLFQKPEQETMTLNYKEVVFSWILRKFPKYKNSSKIEETA